MESKNSDHNICKHQLTELRQTSYVIFTMFLHVSFAEHISILLTYTSERLILTFQNSIKVLKDYNSIWKHTIFNKQKQYQSLYFLRVPISILYNCPHFCYTLDFSKAFYMSFKDSTEGKTQPRLVFKNDLKCKMDSGDSNLCTSYHWKSRSHGFLEVFDP